MTSKTHADARKHIEAINTSINELHLFHARTAAPNPIQHQYVGTIIDSIMGLLCSAGNALDDNNRKIVFDDFNNWTSLMQMIHRTFFSMIHVSIELGLNAICEEFQLQPASSTGKKYLKTIERIETKSTADLDKLKHHFEKISPSFEDTLNAVLAITNLTKERQKIWRNFMKGLTIIRNKSSHSNPKLSENEKSTLRDNGFAVMISKNGELQINTRQYAQTTKYTLDFFDEITTSLRSK